MVTVAIIGVLTAIAVPAFEQMSAEARQSEAKDAAAGMYAAEMSFFADQGAFTCCLYQAGYEPEGKNHYYLTGFWNSCATWVKDYKTGEFCSWVGVPWNGNAWRDDAVYSMNIWANPGLISSTLGQSFGATVKTFRAVAFGPISSTNPEFDVWTIDQGKNLVNMNSGL